jgi:mono/diheme cytochrome c family protein
VGAIVATGCDSTIVGGWTTNNDDDEIEPDAAETAPATAREKFDHDVLPLVTGTCSGCHAGSDPAVQWMKPAPDEYTAMLAWPNLVNLETPSTSTLLIKGQHQGPPWSADQATLILGWIDAERDEHPPEMTVETNAVDVVEGANTLSLDAIGSVGSSVTFTAQKLTNGLYLSQVRITAGPMGVHIKHPLFVTWMDTTPTPDGADSFDTVELDLMANQTATLGGGLVMLPNVPSTAKLSVSFQMIGPPVGSGTTTLAGCKVVSSFTTNARPRLSTSCVGCHGGANGGATNAVDMTKVNDTSPAGQAAACGQILGRVNLTTPAQSGILLAPDPASGVAHPFKFAAADSTTFRNSLTTWINAEKAAP